MFIKLDLYTGKLSASDKSCLCNEMTMSKILIIIFTLLNLTMIASGGVVFTLGLTGYWRNHNNFSQLMVKLKCIHSLCSLHSIILVRLALVALCAGERWQLLLISWHCWAFSRRRRNWSFPGCCGTSWRCWPWWGWSCWPPSTRTPSTASHF